MRGGGVDAWWCGWVMVWMGGGVDGWWCGWVVNELCVKMLVC